MKIIEGQKYYTIFEVAETVKIGIGRTDRAERQRAC